MPDSEREIPPDRSVAAQGERLARVETKVEAIEKGIDIIRSTGHAINGEMQKFVGLEAQCVSHLSAIRELTAHLPEIVLKVQSFDELKPRLNMLIDEHFSRKGGWKAVVMIGTAAMGAVTMIGAIAAGIIFLLGKAGGH